MVEHPDDDGDVKVLLDIKEKKARFKLNVIPDQMNDTRNDQEAVELDQVNIAMSLEAYEEDCQQALLEDMGSNEDSTLWILIFAPFVIILMATVVALLVPMFL